MPTMISYSPLLTDQYQLVMAYGYWKLDKADQESVFHLYYRHNPFNGDFTVACGLEHVIHFLQQFHFSDTDIQYLDNLKAPDNSKLFETDFLDYLSKLTFSCSIDAIPEGTLVFPNEPMLRIQGPLLQCQLLETACLNFLNFPSLVATKAARIYYAARGDDIIEFGLRRAQGPDGGLTASRAAFIGGCMGTSNVLAGKMYGIPVIGTQAHSWIMAFDDELSAFQGFASVMQNNATLLIDTYDSIEGVQNAIRVGKELRKAGKDLRAVRLDSGDMVDLSRRTRKSLDDAGFNKTKIIASNDLDEHMIAELKKQNVPIDIWGVGTQLSTSFDHPALDVVYKLAALKDKNKQWQYKMKFSDSPIKTTTPGIMQVRRYTKQQQILFDVIYHTKLGIDEKLPAEADQCEDLLVPIFREGELIYTMPSIDDTRHDCINQTQRFMKNSRDNYQVTLEPKLVDLKQTFIKAAQKIS